MLPNIKQRGIYCGWNPSMTLVFDFNGGKILFLGLIVTVKLYTHLKKSKME
jgi:hypothetical protein